MKQSEASYDRCVPALCLVGSCHRIRRSFFLCVWYAMIRHDVGGVVHVVFNHRPFSNFGAVVILAESWGCSKT